MVNHQRAARAKGFVLLPMALALLLALPLTSARAQGRLGLSGPKFYADVRLRDGTGDIPRAGGGSITLATLQVDTGSPFTFLNRNWALNMTLITADGAETRWGWDDVAFGGVTGGRTVARSSTPIDIGGQGMEENPFNPGGGWSNTVLVDRVPVWATGTRIVYPKRGEPDCPSLLGTNYLANLPANRVAVFSKTNDPTGRISGKIGRVSFRGAARGRAPGGAGSGATVDLVTESAAPPVEGWEPRRIVPGILLNDEDSADFYLATGSSYTILSQSLADSLGLVPDGSIDLYHSDPDTFNALYADGFFDNVNPGPFQTAVIARLALATEEGPALVYENVPVLINPFDTDQNVFGTNLLLHSDLPSVMDLANNRLSLDQADSPSYSVQFIDPLPGDVSTSASFGHGISDSDVSGDRDLFRVVGSSAGARGHAFIWDQVNGTRDLGTLDSSRPTLAAGIDPRGRFVAGQYRYSARASSAILWDTPGWPADNMWDPGTLGGPTDGIGTEASGVNQYGQATGTSVPPFPNDHDRAFFYQDGVMSEIGVLPGFNSSFGYAINSAGHVAGSSSINSTEHGFFWDGQQMLDLGSAPPYEGNTSAYDLDDFDDVVGVVDRSYPYYDSHALLWSLGGTSATPLSAVDPDESGIPARARSVNRLYDDATVVMVGDDLLAAGPSLHAWVWSSDYGQAYDLNTLIPGDVQQHWTLGQATAVNRDGRILCQAFSDSYQSRCCVLTPNSP